MQCLLYMVINMIYSKEVVVKLIVLNSKCDIDFLFNVHKILWQFFLDIVS
jgi:hypothetical protein